MILFLNNVAVFFGIVALVQSDCYWALDVSDLFMPNIHFSVFRSCNCLK